MSREKLKTTEDAGVHRGRATEVLFPRAPPCTPVSSVVKILMSDAEAAIVKVLFAGRLCRRFRAGQFIDQTVGAVNVAQRFDDAARIDMNRP